MSNKGPSEIDRLVSFRIAALREQVGLTQHALAERLGVTFQQFQKYENAHNRISAGRLYLLARELGTTIADLYNGADELFAARGRGVAEEAVEFGGPLDQDCVELVVAFKSIRKSEARKSLLAMTKEEAARRKRKRD
jgi:transcriptional regulator with XRE-family HTH domain